MNMKKLAAAGLLVAGVAVVLIAGMQSRNSDTPDGSANTANAAAMASATGDGPAVHVYKTATCGCCNKWLTHLEEAGFAVTAENTRELMAVKRREGVPTDLSSCHTALVNGYVVEGHVPASVIQAFLEEAPDAVGLAVPGMPIGSPGMEGRNPEAYDVYAFDEDGGRTVFRRVEP